MESIAGMPGTFHESVKGLRWKRGADAVCPLTYNTSRTYEAVGPDGFLRALVSQDDTSAGKLWHLSVSHSSFERKPDRCPTWDELKHAKFSLVPVDVPMVLIFPRKNCPEPYVNVHSTTLHLWESTDPNIDVD